MSTYGYDDDAIQEILNQYNETFNEIAIVPIKITYTDYTGITFDSVSQTYTGGTPAPKTIYTTCAKKEGKQIGEDGTSILLTSIPAGKIGAFFKWENRINVKDMDDLTKKSLKFEIYYDEEYPTKLNPDEQTTQTQYLMNNKKYPVHQVFICGVEK